jgi:hypothetical protein
LNFSQPEQQALVQDMMTGRHESIGSDILVSSNSISLQTLSGQGMTKPLKIVFRIASWNFFIKI